MDIRSLEIAHDNFIKPAAKAKVRRQKMCRVHLKSKFQEMICINIVTKAYFLLARELSLNFFRHKDKVEDTNLCKEQSSR